MATIGKTITLKNILKMIEEMEGMKELLLERNPMNMHNGINPSNVSVIFKSLKETKLETDTLKSFNIVKCLRVKVLSK
uniref:Zinc finger protein 977 n=1 Tax=Mus musculus TaxID=10090 RepID=A0A9L6KE12_MOUSE